jgi:hypothetical protein
MQMLTVADVDIAAVAAVAARLLEHIPRELEKSSCDYSKTIRYFEHLANGGERRNKDDLILVNIYTSRSAAFAELKLKVSEA